MNQDQSGITAFVVHWNQPEQCLDTVRRLRDQDPRAQIVIIDNASESGAFSRLQSGIPTGVEVTRLDKNNGWGPALNVVLKKWLAAGESEYTLISAHDAEPAPDCVNLLLSAMKNDTRLGIVCPQYPDATVPRFSSLRGVWQDRGVALSSGTVQEVEAPHGTLMLIRRQCLTEIGLFDERYFAYGDEHELGLRAVRHGWKIGLIWGATVANRGTWTPSSLRSYLFTRNSLLLVNDYSGKIQAWMRAILILFNTFRLKVSGRDDGFAFSPAARWRGVRDFFTGQFGFPRSS